MVSVGQPPPPPPEWMVEAGFVAYTLFCFFGIGLFVQGLAWFCAGLTSSKSSLSQISYSMAAASVVMIQFYVVGYSVESADGPDHSWARFVGSFEYAFLRNLDLTDVRQWSHLLLMYGFSIVPACLLASAACQRGRFMPLLVFLAIWMTIVYCPVARWCWHPSGWSYRLGVLDYAGGTIIHITSGFAALVYSLVLGPRVSYLNDSATADLPSSLTYVIQGTAVMWLGWIGFTGGSQITEPAETLMSIFNTWQSAAMGGFSWMILDHVVTLKFLGDRHPGAVEQQYSLISFCSGIVSGLVAITPAAGYVPAWSAPIIGLCGGIGCNLSTRLKFYLGVDDPLDVFAVHGMGGMIGTILTGVFAMEEHRQSWQVVRQIVSAVAAASYTLGCTLMIAVVIDSIPWLAIRIPPEQESLGLDYVEHGETAITAPDPSRQFLGARSGFPQDLARLRQTHVNMPMYSTGFEQPLLQHLPLSYGTYTRREIRPDDFE